MALIHL
ncbi:hypothetical protein ACHAW6_000072 [Cyclotella cf. meneghiniana]